MICTFFVRHVGGFYGEKNVLRLWRNEEGGMLKRETIEAAIKEMAKLNGHELNDQERLIIRTRVSATLAAKERHRQRMNSLPYQWRKKRSPRT